MCQREYDLQRSMFAAIDQCLQKTLQMQIPLHNASDGEAASPLFGYTAILYTILSTTDVRSSQNESCRLYYWIIRI